MYQAQVKLAEPRTTTPAQVSFATKKERDDYCKGEESIVFWYFYVEEDDWDWRRGGAWKRTAKPMTADKENIPPEITPQDRRW